jgi:hypothetical protein
MGTADDTSIRIHRSTWKRLHDRKEPGTSFDDILTDLLDEVESRESADAEPADD